MATRDSGVPIALTRAPSAPVPAADVAVQLHAEDAVAIAKQALAAGTTLRLEGGTEVRTSQLIPPGHKVAISAVAAGEPVRRYGQVIGFATTDIAPGDHVHVHNLAVGELEHDYAFCRDYAAVELVAETDRRTFLGFRRADGRVGTRNYVAVLASVNCSSSACTAVVGEIERSGVLAAHPNVDGVIAFAHKGGCGVTHRLRCAPSPPAHARRRRPPSQRRRLRDPQPRLRGQSAR